MEKDQIPFMVMGYSFLKANQIDLILQEIMTSDWCSQWLPQDRVNVRAEMRADLNQNWLGFNDLPPMKRAINFFISLDTVVTPKIVNQIIAAFSEAFTARMMAMRHGAKPDPFEPIVAAPVNRNMEKRQPSIIIWERYPIKTLGRSKIH